MKLTWKPFTLDLRTTFRIAHGASDQRHNVIVHLNASNGLSEESGLGEAAGVVYFGESQSGIMNYLQSLPPFTGDDPNRIEEILESLPYGSPAARAGIDIALHDLWGKQMGQPLYKLFGLNPKKMPQTSFTIAIDEPELMAQRARDCGYPIIKIKLGSPKDFEIVAAIRAATNARLRLDANSGWTREQALELIPRLIEFDIEFLEQPLPMGDVEGLRWLVKELRAQKITLPIFADENIKTAKDVVRHAGIVDGVVIKLMKTGGIREAVRAITVARAFDMQVMIGCMIETSAGVSAAAHIASLCDHADLDGPLLIRNDPYSGVKFDGANMILPDGPGLGVQLR